MFCVKYLEVLALQICILEIYIVKLFFNSLNF